ncbi:organic cation transporter protein-like, partial [Anneissia japonica]
KKDDVMTKEKVVTKYSIIDLVRTPVLRKRSCNLLFSWFTNAMLYYGLSFQTESLGSSPYLSFFLAGLVEMPSYILAQLLLDRIGRKPILCGYMVFGGVVLLATIVIPE